METFAVEWGLPAREGLKRWYGEGFAGKRRNSKLGVDLKTREMGGHGCNL